jgi:hypothetical protein
MIKRVNDKNRYGRFTQSPKVVKVTSVKENLCHAVRGFLAKRNYYGRENHKRCGTKNIISLGWVYCDGSGCFDTKRWELNNLRLPISLDNRFIKGSNYWRSIHAEFS